MTGKEGALSRDAEGAPTCVCPDYHFVTPAPLFAPGWLDDLSERVIRCGGMGIGPDFAAMSVLELHALWRWLLRRGS